MTNTALPTDDEIEAWADSFIRPNAYHRPTAVQIAMEAAKWVRSQALASKPDARMHAREAAQALPYSTTLELWKAFKAGVKFVLHYHGKTYDVIRMEPHEKVVFVQPPSLPVKVFPDGRGCEGTPNIWLEQRTDQPPALASSPQSPPVVEGAVREALAELVAAKESQDAQRRLARRYYMPDKALAADDRVERAWKAARAALASPQSSPVAPDVEGLKRLAIQLKNAAYSHGADDQREHASDRFYAKADQKSRDALAALHAAIDALSAHGVKQPEPADALDARRYRWLRINSYVEVRCDSPRHPDWRPDALDAAIDAAMSKERPIHEARPDDRKEQT
jgi:hypothetical protein